MNGTSCHLWKPSPQARVSVSYFEAGASALTQANIRATFASWLRALICVPTGEKVTKKRDARDHFGGNIMMKRCFAAILCTSMLFAPLTA
ncbi:hypothetical protein [Sulfitobacter sediminilitoris]|nr:hypothetical protein [Sulfitobacter sediminilitoris]